MAYGKPPPTEYLSTVLHAQLYVRVYDVQNEQGLIQFGQTTHSAPALFRQATYLRLDQVCKNVLNNHDWTSF